ncbi:MAG: hypothetical protein DRJ07_12670, partial [Bacteroidetes bacterium]
MLKHRMVIILLLLIIQSFVCSKVFAQKLISENFQNEPMTSVLSTISQKYQMKFSYDYTLLEKVKVSGSYENINERNFIRQLSSKYKFDIEKVDGVYLIKPQNKPTKNHIIKGVIVDEKSKERLPYANIHEQNPNYVTASNQDGFFTLFASRSDTNSYVV